MMTEWQVVASLLALTLAAQEWAHRRERRDLLDRLMVDKGHTAYLGEDKPPANQGRGSMIRAGQVKRARNGEEAI